MPSHFVTAVALALAAAPATEGMLTHAWDTVGDAMFGWLGPPYTDEILDFYAEKYRLVVLGGSFTCNTSDIEAWDAAVGARSLKQRNPNITILLYEATQFGALCVGGAEMQQHPEWWLRDDHGKVYNRTVNVHGVEKSLGPASIDWRIQGARSWWVKTVTQLHDGIQLFHGLLVDSAGPDIHLDNTTHYISLETEKDLVQAKMLMLSEAKTFFKQANGGEVLGNPTLEWGVVGYPDRESKLPFSDPHYHWQFLTGTLDEMFGGFGSQQSNGQWNASTMNISISAIVQSSTELGATVLVRGYPGPCSTPFISVNASCIGSDMCPKTGPKAGIKTITVPTWPEAWPEVTPTTVEGLQSAAARLIDQALAPYLIVTGPSVWWSYAYFYGSDTGFYECKANPKSCLAPAGWYPALRAKLGKPLGPAKNTGWKWSREFEFATVSIDLEDRTASRVSFHNERLLADSLL